MKAFLLGGAAPSTAQQWAIQRVLQHSGMAVQNGAAHFACDEGRHSKTVSFPSTNDTADAEPRAQKRRLHEQQQQQQQQVEPIPMVNQHAALTPRCSPYLRSLQLTTPPVTYVVVKASDGVLPPLGRIRVSRSFARAYAMEPTPVDRARFWETAYRHWWRAGLNLSVLDSNAPAMKLLEKQLSRLRRDDEPSIKNTAITSVNTQQNYAKQSEEEMKVEEKMEKALRQAAEEQQLVEAKREKHRNGASRAEKKAKGENDACVSQKENDTDETKADQQQNVEEREEKDDEDLLFLSLLEGKTTKSASGMKASPVQENKKNSRKGQKRQPSSLAEGDGQKSGAVDGDPHHINEEEREEEDALTFSFDPSQNSHILPCGTATGTNHVMRAGEPPLVPPPLFYWKVKLCGEWHYGYIPMPDTLLASTPLPPSCQHEPLIRTPSRGIRGAPTDSNPSYVAHSSPVNRRSSSFTLYFPKSAPSNDRYTTIGKMALSRRLSDATHPDDNPSSRREIMMTPSSAHHSTVAPMNTTVTSPPSIWIPLSLLFLLPFLKRVQQFPPLMRGYNTVLSARIASSSGNDPTGAPSDSHPMDASIPYHRKTRGAQANRYGVGNREPEEEEAEELFQLHRMEENSAKAFLRPSKRRTSSSSWAATFDSLSQSTSSYFNYKNRRKHWYRNERENYKHINDQHSQKTSEQKDSSMSAGSAGDKPDTSPADGRNNKNSSGTRSFVSLCVNGPSPSFVHPDPLAAFPLLFYWWRSSRFEYWRRPYFSALLAPSVTTNCQSFFVMGSGYYINVNETVLGPLLDSSFCTQFKLPLTETGMVFTEAITAVNQVTRDIQNVVQRRITPSTMRRYGSSYRSGIFRRRRFVFGKSNNSFRKRGQYFKSVMPQSPSDETCPKPETADTTSKTDPSDNNMEATNNNNNNNNSAAACGTAKKSDVEKEGESEVLGTAAATPSGSSNEDGGVDIWIAKMREERQKVFEREKEAEDNASSHLLKMSRQPSEHKKKNSNIPTSAGSPPSRFLPSQYDSRGAGGVGTSSSSSSPLRWSPYQYYTSPYWVAVDTLEQRWGVTLSQHPSVRFIVIRGKKYVNAEHTTDASVFNPNTCHPQRIHQTLGFFGLRSCTWEFSETLRQVYRPPSPPSIIHPGEEKRISDNGSLATTELSDEGGGGSLWVSLRLVQAAGWSLKEGSLLVHLEAGNTGTPHSFSCLPPRIRKTSVYDSRKGFAAYLFLSESSSAAALQKTPARKMNANGQETHGSDKKGRYGTQNRFSASSQEEDLGRPEADSVWGINKKEKKWHQKSKTKRFPESSSWRERRKTKSRPHPTESDSGSSSSKTAVAESAISASFSSRSSFYFTNECFTDPECFRDFVRHMDTLPDTLVNASDIVERDGVMWMMSFSPCILLRSPRKLQASMFVRKRESVSSNRHEKDDQSRYSSFTFSQDRWEAERKAERDAFCEEYLEKSRRLHASLLPSFRVLLALFSLLHRYAGMPSAKGLCSSGSSSSSSVWMARRFLEDEPHAQVRSDGSHTGNDTASHPSAELARTEGNWNRKEKLCRSLDEPADRQATMEEGGSSNMGWTEMAAPPHSTLHTTALLSGAHHLEDNGFQAACRQLPSSITVVMHARPLGDSFSGPGVSARRVSRSSFGSHSASKAADGDDEKKVPHAREVYVTLYNREELDLTQVPTEEIRSLL